MRAEIRDTFEGGSTSRRFLVASGISLSSFGISRWLVRGVPSSREPETSEQETVRGLVASEKRRRPSPPTCRHRALLSRSCQLTAETTSTMERRVVIFRVSITVTKERNTGCTPISGSMARARKAQSWMLTENCVCVCVLDHAKALSGVSSIRLDSVKFRLFSVLRCCSGI